MSKGGGGRVKKSANRAGSIQQRVSCLVWQENATRWDRSSQRVATSEVGLLTNTAIRWLGGGAFGGISDLEIVSTT